MAIFSRLAALVCLALAGGLSTAPSASAQSPSSDRGHDLLERHCAICHAVNRSGASPNPAAPLFRELHRRYPIDALGEALAEGIIVGHPQMPAFEFSADQIADIIRYLKSIQAAPSAKVDPPAERQSNSRGRSQAPSL